MTIAAVKVHDLRFALGPSAGSDAIHRDPVY